MDITAMENMDTEKKEARIIKIKKQKSLFQQQDGVGNETKMDL